MRYSYRRRIEHLSQDPEARTGRAEIIRGRLMPFYAGRASLEHRKKELKKIASKISGWYSRNARDSLILVRPEGYGKSHLVINLIEKGFKVIFCTKSNAQLMEKADEFEKYALHVPDQSAIDQPSRFVLREDGVLELSNEAQSFSRPAAQHVRVARVISKGLNLELAAIEAGVPRGEFQVLQSARPHPYANSAVDEPATLKALGSAFKANKISLNAHDFFAQHYTDHKRTVAHSSDYDVVMVTQAALQSMLTAQRRPWWVRLNLWVSRYLRRSEKKDIPYYVYRPCEKVVLVIDDPDRTDFDWMRELSDDQHDALRGELERDDEFVRTYKPMIGKRMTYVPRSRGPKTLGQQLSERYQRIVNCAPVEIVHIKGYRYIRRPRAASFGANMRTANGIKHLKTVVTTTEHLTALFAERTLQKFGRVELDSELDHASECKLTVIPTNLTRKTEHAVLLPIVEKLKEEFPKEPITFIGDGLDLALNLSNSKGRNNLTDHDIIVKLSAPHPAIVRPLQAQVSEICDVPDDLLAVMHLADLANQAIGRNQGLRFRNKQTILLVEPRYHKLLMENELLRYKITPWSKQVGTIDSKYKRPPGFHIALRFIETPSDLELRLIELMNDAEVFGHSDDAERLMQSQPMKQRRHFDQWIRHPITKP